MNPEIKAKWLKGLRSGEYKQGQERLRNGDKFCCLGVLCDIVDPEGWEEYGQHRGYSGIPNAALFADMFGFANHTTNPYFPGKNAAATDLNDSGATFAELADLIEEQL